jgi:hypothetical protein
VPAEQADQASIRVSIAVPESYFLATIRAEQERNPATDTAACETREQERIRAHVLQLLPAAASHEVLITSFPTPATRTARRSPPPRTANGTPPAAAAVAAPDRGDRRTPGQIVDAACEAVAAGRMEDVPREAWVVAMAACAAILAMLVLRGSTAGGSSSPARPRRSQARIDWSSLDNGGPAPTPAADDGSFHTSSRKVAA